MLALFCQRELAIPEFNTALLQQEVLHLDRSPLPWQPQKSLRQSSAERSDLFESQIRATMRKVEGFPTELMTMIIAGAAEAMDTAIQRSLASHWSLMHEVVY